MVGESLSTKILMGLCVAAGGVVGMYFVQGALEPRTVRDILKKEGHRIIYEGGSEVTDKEREWFGQIVDVIDSRGGNFKTSFEKIIRYPRWPPTENATDNQNQKIFLLKKFCEFSLGTMEDSEDFRDALEQSRIFCTHHDGNVPKYEINE